jgi:hypothetical protein
MMKMSQLKSQAIMADVTGIPSTSSGQSARFLPHGKSCNVLYGDRSARMVQTDGEIKDLVIQISAQSKPPMSMFLNPTDPANPGLWELFDKQ